MKSQPFVTTFMVMEGIMLSEIRLRKTKDVFTYVWNLKNKRTNITNQKWTHKEKN